MSLQDQLNEDFAEAWRPQPGDQIIGTVTSFGQNTTQYGTYVIVTLKSDDGSRKAVHAYHTVLANELEKIRPQIGHKLGIKYLGKPEGKSYDMYRVATDHPPEQVWAAPDPRDEVPEQASFEPPEFTAAEPPKADESDDIPF